MPVSSRRDSEPWAASLVSRRAVTAFNLFGNARDGVIRIVVVEISLDVLGVVDVAVITLAVIFPDELPVGVDVKVHDLGDLGACPALGAWPTGAIASVDRIEIGGSAARLMKISPPPHAAWAGCRPSCDLIQTFLHAVLEQ